MLLLLDSATFALNDEGDRLAQHVRIARASHLPVLLVHDDASCEFDTCIEMTPDDLVTGGLYRHHVAVPLGTHPLERCISHELLLRQMHKLAPPRQPHRLVGVEFDLSALFGFGRGARSGSFCVSSPRRGSLKASEEASGARGARSVFHSSARSVFHSPRRISNARHVLQLEELGTALVDSSAVDQSHAHVLRLAQRGRRRSSMLSRLAIAPPATLRAAVEHDSLREHSSLREPSAKRSCGSVSDGSVSDNGSCRSKGASQRVEPAVLPQPKSESAPADGAALAGGGGSEMTHDAALTA